MVISKVCVSCIDVPISLRSKPSPGKTRMGVVSREFEI